MKKSKLRGYIYDLEHKNKYFSFDKTIRILDISNMIYIDISAIMPVLDPVLWGQGLGS